MERKYANHPGWQRILQSRYYQTYLENPAFTGHVTLFCMDAVRAPLVVHFFDRPNCIVDAGYAWLKHFPTGEHFTITTTFDDRARIVQWYIDIVLRMGVNEDHVPWMDDLYLDLVVTPAMEVYVKDADELLAARESGEITNEQFDLAWRVAGRLKGQIEQGAFGLLGLSELHRKLLLENGRG